MKPIAYHQHLCEQVFFAGDVEVGEQCHGTQGCQKAGQHEPEQFGIMLPHEGVRGGHGSGALLIFAHQSECTDKEENVDAAVAQQGTQLNEQIAGGVQDALEERIGTLAVEIEFIAVVAGHAERVRQIVAGNEQNAQAFHSQ